MVGRSGAAALLMVMPVAAGAQGAAESFKGKTVDIYTGYTVGGGYDLYTRLLARHIGKHLPGNPTVVPKNMECPTPPPRSRAGPRGNTSPSAA
jgi:tripartite-type tricarboxylate transporter receptor subunit TctC